MGAVTLADRPRPSEPETVIFSADSSRQNIISSAREAWKYRGFIMYMTRRDLRITYLRSYLGWAWSLINPIAEIAIYSLVFGVILDGNRTLPTAPDAFKSFPHFLICGLVIWNFYRSTSSKVLNTFTATVKLRRKLYFPPVAPALSQALTTIIQNSLELVVVFLFFLAFGHISPSAIVLLPAALFATLSGLGVGLLLSVANTRYRDVGYLYSIFLRLFFYLIPIIWPLEFVDDRIGLPWLRTLVIWNPFAKMISFARDGIYLQQWPSFGDWVYLSAWSAGLLLLGWAVFARSSADVAEGVS